MSLLLSGAGGISLALEGSGAAAVPTFIGIWLIGAGFNTMWQGIRVFYGEAPDWPRSAAVLTFTAIAIAATAGEQRALQNIIYVGVQIFPIVLAAMALQRTPLRLGVLVVFGGIALALTGHIAEASTNLARLIGVLSSERYYDFAAWFLAAALVGGSVCYLGFLLMAIDRLRADLVALSITDDLTGLPNRRGFHEKARAFDKARHRQQSSACVLMIDLDNFKIINDRHGHAAGDACLIHVARVAERVLRRGDILARLSGDEFCLLFPDTDLREAEGIAERLTTALSAEPVEWRGYHISLSASLGLTEWNFSSDCSIHDALEQADAALYRAKREGRDGLAIYAANGSVQ
ncbi:MULTISPECIES: GGDEF domain-containing protein [unclassified Chelatococcus]|uniref:GGDEF domain-containing protein n=1 Tax=unclassified Chelatococcus TaxID=2638111 RepID=UPI001BCBEC3E|nr:MULTISPECIES: GGDEF domain-containing protein [unclassified Chelatococcus]MBS7700444.1 GGDEF domain-containing protein [Chelatococcus sp. YT9]MBX3556240.1 GGDEF domain-containing protein [Chelatococcus sp.]